MHVFPSPRHATHRGIQAGRNFFGPTWPGPYSRTCTYVARPARKRTLSHFSALSVKPSPQWTYPLGETNPAKTRRCAFACGGGGGHTPDPMPGRERERDILHWSGQVSKLLREAPAWRLCRQDGAHNRHRDLLSSGKSLESRQHRGSVGAQALLRGVHRYQTRILQVPST